MKTTSFDLLFLPAEDNRLVGRSIANVFVKSYSGNEYDGRGEGKMFVSQECASYREFSAEIDRLQVELELLRISARFQFQQEGERPSQEAMSERTAIGRSPYARL
jgi:hypothetical protein